MNKQSFLIPEGCKAVTMEQIGNQIITTFEPVFKRGDVLICYDETTNACINRFIFIFKDLVSDNMSKGMCAYVSLFLKTLDLHYEDRLATDWDVLRHATPDEAQRLWDALTRNGKRWNPKAMQVEEIKKERWRAEVDQNYYTYNAWLKIVLSKETKDEIDDKRHYQGRYFQTEEQAQRAAARLKAELDKFWEEEL